MLVKIGPGVYVNSDHVIRLSKKDGTWNLKQIETEPFAISAAAASYLMDNMETANAVILPGEDGYVDYSDPAYVAAQPLTSRVAQFLRDECVQGIRFSDLVKIFYYSDPEITDGKMHDALSVLIQDHVVVNIKPEGSELFFYFHALHVPAQSETSNLKPETSVTPTLDPSISTAPLVSSLEEGTESLIDLTNSDLCPNCKNPYSSQDHYYSSCAPLAGRE